MSHHAHKGVLRRLYAPGSRRGDEGSALVASVAVAFIVMALGLVVMTQSVVVTQDAGRDRNRTVQVHGAEGLVDALYAELESSAPCPTCPTAGVEVVNTAPGNTEVLATIEYFDEAGAPLPCVAGAPSGTPARAVITATAESSQEIAGGLQPSRTVQSEVLLEPLATPGHGAAIFSAAGGEVTNTSITNPTSPDTPADVWIDSGDVNCNSGGQVNGRLLVPQGRADFSNSCKVTGDVWTRNGITIHQAPPGGAYSITGNLHTMGAATIASGVKIGGDLLAGGNITSWGTFTVDGQRRANVTVPPLAPVGLPEVTYRPADWSGFAVESYPEWIKWNADGAGGTRTPAATWSNFRKPASTANQCGQLSKYDYGIGGTLRTRTAPRVYDAWDCGTIQIRELDLVLYSDLVIFAKGFNLTNTVNIRSGDGADHRLWLIVPDRNPNGVAECAGGASTVEINSSVTTHANTSMFVYSPCAVNMSNQLTLRGQVYGRNVILRNNVVINYVPMGIPGVTNLGGSPSAGGGFSVDVAYKRETSG